MKEKISFENYSLITILIYLTGKTIFLIFLFYLSMRINDLNLMKTIEYENEARERKMLCGHQ